MVFPEKGSEKSECPSGCSRCSSADQTVAAGEDVFTGWRLAAAALWVFVLPLAIALVGTVLSRWYWPGPGRMLLSALAGLVVGGVISSIASRFIRTTHTVDPIPQAYVEPHSN